MQQNVISQKTDQLSKALKSPIIVSGRCPVQQHVETLEKEMNPTHREATYSDISRPRISAGFESATHAPDQSRVVENRRFYFEGTQNQLDEGVWVTIQASREAENMNTTNAGMVPVSHVLSHKENTSGTDVDIYTVGMKGNVEFRRPLTIAEKLKTNAKLGAAIGAKDTGTNIAPKEGTYSFYITARTPSSDTNQLLYNRHHELDLVQLSKWNNFKASNLYNEISEIDEKNGLVHVIHHPDDASLLGSVIINLNALSHWGDPINVSYDETKGTMIVSAKHVADAINAIKEARNGLEINAGLDEQKVFIQSLRYDQPSNNAKPSDVQKGLLDMVRNEKVCVSGIISTEYFLFNFADGGEIQQQE